MQGFEKEIADRYDLDIKNIAPYKDVYIVNTQEGKKLLKRSILSAERILFVHSAKEHLCKNEFENIDRYICSTDGTPYVNIEGNNYVLTDAIEGVESNFDNRNDIINVSRLLAGFHKASKNYIPPGDCVVRDDLGKLPVFFSKRLDEIKKLKKVARKGKSKFDYLFMEYYDYFCNLGEDAISLLGHSKYDDLVRQARQEGVFCHHDYTHHNIICSKEKFTLINFEYCSLELKIYDIANLIRRKMRKCNWDINEAKVILDEYKKIENISDDEFFVMKIMLQFPQKFWRVINKYYNSKRSWSEKSFVTRLYEVIDEVEYHKKFMEKFDSII